MTKEGSQISKYLHAYELSVLPHMHIHPSAMNYARPCWHNAGMLAGQCMVNKDGMSDPLSHCCSSQVVNARC